MDSYTLQLAILLIYKLCGLILGFLCVFLGYKLFSKGIFDSHAEVQATFSNNKLLLKKAAPGTFFALFGIVVMISISWRSIEITSSSPITSSEFAVKSIDSNAGDSFIQKTYIDTTDSQSHGPISPPPPTFQIRSEKLNNVDSLRRELTQLQ